MQKYLFPSKWPWYVFSTDSIIVSFTFLYFFVGCESLMAIFSNDFKYVLLLFIIITALEFIKLANADEKQQNT